MPYFRSWHEQQGKDWIFQHWSQAEAVATHLRKRVESFPQFERKLNVLYLISDSLHHALVFDYLLPFHFTLRYLVIFFPPVFFILLYLCHFCHTNSFIFCYYLNVTTVWLEEQ